MEPHIEYYYGEALRWSFGFENPNKAAVIFACLIPLLGFLWSLSWRPSRLMLKIPAIVLAASLILGAWYCLNMTYSRGGLVASVAGLAYLAGVGLWQTRRFSKPSFFSAQSIASLLLGLLMLGMVLWSGLAERSATALGNDRSVGNRIDLWSGALQMAAENPRGFGQGKSGEKYMQWYQAIDRDEAYRTMVNSYLTFLVERGWLLSLGIVGLFLVFWSGTRGEKNESFTLALRGSLVAFFSAAFFSTTMEEAKLWILPIACFGLLIFLAIKKRRRPCAKKLIFSAALLSAAAMFLYAYGLWQSKKDDLQREFGKIDGSISVIACSPKAKVSSELGCFPQEEIIGTQAAKRLRELALNAQVKLILGKQALEPKHILIMGSAIHTPLPPNRHLYLLAPDFLSEKDARKLIQTSSSITLLLPEIDEDARVAFWEGVLDETEKKEASFIGLRGVGNRVDWAWDEVIQIISQVNE